MGEAGGGATGSSCRRTSRHKYGVLARPVRRNAMLSHGNGVLAGILCQTPTFLARTPRAAPPTCQTPETVAPAATLPVTPRPSPMSRVVPRAMNCGRWHEIGGNELRNAAVGSYSLPTAAFPGSTPSRPQKGPPRCLGRRWRRGRATYPAEREAPFSPGKLFAKRSLLARRGPPAARSLSRGCDAPRRRPYITFVDSSLRSIHSVSLSAGLLSPRPTTSETAT